jgi:hypothetical protein
LDRIRRIWKRSASIFLCGLKSLTFGSLSKVLRRIAYPVKPFSFDYFQSELPSALLESCRNKMWKQPGLFE